MISSRVILTWLLLSTNKHFYFIIVVIQHHTSSWNRLHIVRSTHLTAWRSSMVYLCHFFVDWIGITTDNIKTHSPPRRPSMPSTAPCSLTMLSGKTLWRKATPYSRLHLKTRREILKVGTSTWRIRAWWPKAKPRRARKQTVGSSILPTSFRNCNAGNQVDHFCHTNYKNKGEFLERLHDDKPQWLCPCPIKISAYWSVERKMRRHFLCQGGWRSKVM